MSNLSVADFKGQLVVDSRLIAQELGIQHKTFMDTIRKYQTQIESAFGHLAVETATVTNSVGAKNETTFYYLNEDQATFLMTASRNTEQVIKCKLNLVKAFSKAKALIVQKEVPQPVERVLPVHTAVEYANAANQVNSLKDGILKQLIQDALVDELELQRNLKYLPVAEKPKKYTIVKVRAKQLGYSDKEIGNGSALGTFVRKLVDPSFQEQVGRFPVYHYEISDDLDDAIKAYFS